MRLGLIILENVSILMLICLIVVCVISFVENRRLSVTRYQIKDDLIPDAFHGYQIVQISDLHDAAFGKNNERLVDKVAALKPDLILVTGDAIVGKPGNDVKFAADTLNLLSKIAPVYFSMGNHELRAKVYTDVYQDMWECFEKRLLPEIHLLLDEKTVILRGDSCIHLYGLNLTPEFYKRGKRTQMPEEYLTTLFGACDPEKYHIFMAHNPVYFEEYAQWGANLVFSGHFHGGMIRLPFLGGVISPMIHFFPKYDKGLFTHSNRYMILSGGLGSHTFRFRVNNLPEIVSVTLLKETI